MSQLKTWVRRFLDEEAIATHRAKILWAQNLVSYFVAGDLKKLALIFGSDKWGFHFYCQHYQTHLQGLRQRPIQLLEIGIGGNEDPALGGNSLRMWRRFFPKGQIHGLDIADKSIHQARRIHIHRGSQADPDYLRRLAKEIGEIDIIIDDGSHQNEHVLISFETLFPLLKAGGWYIVEDTETAYIPKFGGSSEQREEVKSSINFFKSLIHGLHYNDFQLEGYEPTYYDQNILSLFFYHNMVFIQKGDNSKTH